MDKETIDVACVCVYNEDQARKIAQDAAQTAVMSFVQSVLNPAPTYFDNNIPLSDKPPQKGDDLLSTRIRQRIQLPNGETIWCTGNTLASAISNLLAKYMIGVSQETEIKQVPAFKDYAKHWYETYHVPKVRHNTANNTKTLLKLHIYPFIADKTLSNITHDDIQQIFSALADKSKSTAAKVKITLNEIFSNAKEDGYVYTNVVDSDRYVLPTAKKKRTAMTKQVLQSIIAQLPKLRIQDRLLVSLAIYTGMRRGEILALKWEDIDFDRRLIYVRRSVVFEHNRPVIKGTKSSAGIRDIPLDAELLSILNKSDSKSGFVIKNRLEKDSPITETEFKRMFDRIKKTIDLHGATMHIFRHTYATLRKPQCDIKTLQRIMGHSDIKVTMDTYVDAIDEDIQKLSEITLLCDTSCDTPSP